MQQLNVNPFSPALDVRALRARIAGDVVTPADESWDEARQAWNLAVDQRPVAVVLAETVDDVVATIEHARAAGLRVAPQGTRHNATPLDLEDTILLRTSRMRRVEIDPEAEIARVEAGVIWIEVVETAAEHGLAALAGSGGSCSCRRYPKSPSRCAAARSPSSRRSTSATRRRARS